MLLPSLNTNRNKDKLRIFFKYVTVIDEYKNIFITMDENKIAKYGVCLNEIDNKN